MRRSSTCPGADPNAPAFRDAPAPIPRATYPVRVIRGTKGVAKMATRCVSRMTESTDLEHVTITCASCRRETRFEHARADLSAWRASPIGDSYCVTCLAGTRSQCAGCRRACTVDAARWEAWQFSPQAATRSAPGAPIPPRAPTSSRTAARAGAPTRPGASTTRTSATPARTGASGSAVHPGQAGWTAPPDQVGCGTIRMYGLGDSQPSG